jgi:phosphomevalonate kinase
VEQAIQFSVAAAKATITERGKKDALDKLLLQGFETFLL